MIEGPGAARRTPGGLAATRLAPARAGPRALRGSDRLDAAVTDDARGMLAQGSTGRATTAARGERRLDHLAVFVQLFAPPPRMLVFGAIDFAASGPGGNVPGLPRDRL